MERKKKLTGQVEVSEVRRLVFPHNIIPIIFFLLNIKL